MLKLDFSPVFCFDQQGDLDSHRFFTFEGKDPSESIPDKFTVNSLSEHALLEFSVMSKENVLDHLLLVGVELVVLLSVGQADGTAGVYYQVGID